MTLLTLLVALASMTTGGTCAAHDNGANMSAWAETGTTTHATTYADMGERLVYADAPGYTDADNRAWMALHASERLLLVGPTGHKVVIACI